jgi:hypothetical protein
MKMWLLRARQAWMDVATSIGTFQARVLLTVLYFTWLVPFGLLARFLSDPLALRKAARRPATTGWKRRPAQGHAIQALRNQY